MELEYETEGPKFYDLAKNNEEIHLKHQQMHPIHSFSSEFNGKSEIPIVPLNHDENRYGIGYEIENEEDDNENAIFKEYISSVQEWVKDMKTASELRKYYGCWICHENETENYLILRAIDDNDANKDDNRNPSTQVIMFYSSISTKMKLVEEVKCEFKYDTYTTIHWAKIIPYLLICKWDEFAWKTCSNYRLEVRMKKK